MQPMIFFLIVLCWFSFSTVKVHCYTLGTVGMMGERDVDVFISWIEKASKKGVDLLLMPELILLSLPEEVSVGDNPCLKPNQDSPSQHLLSCAVMKNNLYFSYNMMEFGDKCRKGVDPRCFFGRYVFNTEVVMERNGTILQKYRKKHIPLDMEWLFTNGNGKPVYFDTDFGVRFGMFTCYDLFFKTPSEVLMKEYGIDHFLFSHHFPVVNPLTPLQFQQGWSEFFSVELTASNNGPCGIYSSGVPLAYNNTKENDFLVTSEFSSKKNNKESRERERPSNAIMNKNNPSTNRLPLEYHRDPVKGENKTYEFLYRPGISNKVVLTLTDFTCILNYETSKTAKVSTKQEYFRFSAATLDMDAVFQPFNSTMYFCGLMNCGESTFDCNVFEVYRNIRTNSYFDKIELEMIFQEDTPVRMVLPFLSTDEADLFKEFKNLFDISHGKYEHSMRAKKPISQPVLDFAFLGEFDDD